MAGLTEWTHGAIALCAAFVLYVIARHRFSQPSERSGPADAGLD